MTSARQLLARQAAWQKSLRSLSWAEKIRLAEKIRDSAMVLRTSLARRPPAGRLATKSRPPAT